MSEVNTKLIRCLYLSFLINFFCFVATSYAVSFLQGFRQSEPALFSLVLSQDLAGLHRKLSAGENIDAQDSDGQTPLMQAAFCGYAHVVYFLLLRGAKVNERNSVGFSALMLAAWAGHEQIVKMLLNAGALTYLRDYQEGKTAYQHAHERGYFGITLLIDNYTANYRCGR